MDTKQIAAMLTMLLLASIVLMWLAHWWLARRNQCPHCPRCRSRDLVRDGPAARCRGCGSVFRSPGGM